MNSENSVDEARKSTLFFLFYYNANFNSSADLYLFFGLDGNSKKSDWNKRFGDELSSNYNSDGDNIYSYENDYKGNNFGIEFTVSGETPNKITVYKYSNE